MGLASRSGTSRLTKHITAKSRLALVWIGAFVGLAALGATVQGCGGSDSNDGQLVAVQFRGSVHFPAANEQELGVALPINSETTVYRDGHGVMRPRAANREFQMPAAELDDLENSLTSLDLRRLQQQFGADPGDNSTISITYNEQTAVLGQRRLPRDLARVADGRLLDVLTRIDEFARPAPSQAEKRARKQIECLQSGGRANLCGSR